MKLQAIRTSRRGIRLALLVGVALTGVLATTTPGVGAQEDAPTSPEPFPFALCNWATSGGNRYFILEPGYQLVYAGEEDGESLELVITVLGETEVVDGVETRVVEEFETANGEVVEISRNFFAICTQSNTVHYFGEDVDIYESGEIASHDGAWRAGIDAARAGVVMLNEPHVGDRYSQEVAPGVAMDQAEVVSLSEVVETPAGTFDNCLFTVETTILEPGHESLKWYAPGIGLIQDGAVQLVQIGA